MANMNDYLDWRGDLTFYQDPFCEVDNLILAQLAYTDFDGIVPDLASGEKISLRDVFNQYYKLHTAEEILHRVSFVKLAPFLMDKLVQTARFQNIRLMAYENHINQEKGSQFSAITYELGDGSLCIAYRGTDDTFTGWKEDFKFSYQDETIGQGVAVDYLNAIASGAGKKRLRVCGHSKGGNFAVYAAAMAEPEFQQCLDAVYTNDGPGFRGKLLRNAGYHRVLPLIHSFIPEDSVIGLLLENMFTHTVVKCKGIGIMQHDAMNWEVLGHRFVRVAAPSETSRFFQETFRRWIDGMSDRQREEFVHSLFSIVEATGARTIGEIKKEGLISVGEMLRKMWEMPKEKQADFLGAWGRLIASAKDTLEREREGESEE
ncbi:MAG: DUF2974 domain-containing protein [Blautia sp.]|nr:DUF2974 domain-containing protein [Blautia sp.]